MFVKLALNLLYFFIRLIEFFFKQIDVFLHTSRGLLEHLVEQLQRAIALSLASYANEVLIAGQVIGKVHHEGKVAVTKPNKLPEGILIRLCG